MSHCVASYANRDCEVYSLRDSNNMPHATMEKDQQIKGKGNGSINPKYIKYVVEFLEFTGMEVRDSEMNNLGYVNVEKVLKENKEIDFGNDLFKGKYFYKEDLEKVKNKDCFEMWDCFGLFDFDINMKVKFNFSLTNTIQNFQKVFTNIKKSTKKIMSGGDDAQMSGGDYAKMLGGYSAKMSGGDYAQMSGGNSAQMLGGDYAKMSGGYSAQMLGGDSAQMSGGDSAKMSGGYSAKMSGGDYAKMSGGNSAKMSGGHSAQMSGGDSAQMLGGDYAKMSGGNSAQMLGGHSAQMSGGDSAQMSGGDYAQIKANKYCTIAVSNHSSLDIGEHSIIVCGTNSKAKGKLGAVIVFYDRTQTGEIKETRTIKIDGNEYKKDIWYTMKNDKVIECK